MLERSEEQFPELPMQWRDHGYEIDQRLGKGAYGAVYRLVKNRGAENEEFSALKVISWELGTEQIREYDNDLEKARRNFSRLFNKAVNEVSILESLAGEAHIVQLKGSCIEKMPEENYCRLYIQMEYPSDIRCLFFLTDIRIPVSNPVCSHSDDSETCQYHCENHRLPAYSCGIRCIQGNCHRDHFFSAASFRIQGNIHKGPC